MNDRDSIAWKMVAQQAPMTPGERMMQEVFERQRLNLPLHGAVPGRMDLPPPIPLDQLKPVPEQQTDLPDLPSRIPPEGVPMSSNAVPVQVARATDYNPDWEGLDVVGGRYDG